MKHCIKHLLGYRLRNEEYFGFHSEFHKLINESALSVPYQALVSLYNAQYALLKEAVDVVQASDFTREMSEADAQRILGYRRVRAGARGFLRHAKKAKREAGHRVTLVFDHYGNVPRTSRDERSYRIVNLVAELRENEGANVELLGLSGWLDELEADNQVYLTLKEARNEEHYERAPRMSMEGAREGVDFAYESVVCQLQVHGVLHPTAADFLSLAFGVNDTIDHYNHLAAQRYGIMRAKRRARNTPEDQACTPPQDAPEASRPPPDPASVSAPVSQAPGTPSQPPTQTPPPSSRAIHIPSLTPGVAPEPSSCISLRQTLTPNIYLSPNQLTTTRFSCIEEPPPSSST